MYSFVFKIYNFFKNNNYLNNFSNYFLIVSYLRYKRKPNSFISFITTYFNKFGKENKFYYNIFMHQYCQCFKCIKISDFPFEKPMLKLPEWESSVTICPHIKV